MTRLAVVEKHTILQSQDAGVKSLEVVIALVVKEFKMSRRRRVVKRCRKNIIYFLLRFSPVARFIFFSGRERAIFYKSCNLIGSVSGQYSLHPARSQRAASDPMFRSFLGNLLNRLLISLRK